MTIQVLDNVIVPMSVLLAGVIGTHARKNVRGVNQGGYATVNVVRDVTMRGYQIGIAPMFAVDAAKVLNLREVTDAGAFGMLMEDPIDSTVSVSQGALQGYQQGAEFGVPGFGNGGPLYGLRKLYNTNGSPRTYARALTRMRGTPSLFRGGTPVTIGGGAGQAALSAGPVYATFTPDTTRSITALTVGATTQVALTSAIAGLVVGGRLWLQDMTGADAALLNNMSHEITGIASNVYTLVVNTAGKTITYGSAEAHKYPQPDEALTWSGDFYVPVHFRDDAIEWELVTGGQRDARMVQIPSCYLDEIREA